MFAYLTIVSKSLMVPFHRCFLVCLVICAFTNGALSADPPITDVAFSPDGNSLVAVGQFGLTVYSWPDLKQTKTIKTSFANSHCVAFGQQGKTLLVAGGDPGENGSVDILSWPDCKVLHTDQPHRDLVMGVAWIGTDRWLSASLDRSVRVTSEGETGQPLSGHSRGVSSICALQEGKLAVSAGLDNSLRVWNVESGDLIRSLSQHTKPVKALALRPGNEGLPLVASASEDRTIRFWQPTIGRMVRYVRLESTPLDIAWLPDGERLAAACADGKVRIIDATNVKVLSVFEAIDGWAYAIAVHPTDNFLVVAGERSQVVKIKLEE